MNNKKSFYKTYCTSLTIMSMIVIMMTSGIFGCSGRNGQVVYNIATMTAAGSTIYSQFEDINHIVSRKLTLFDEVDQKTILEISKKFAEVKLDIDGESGNGEDIRKIMIRFSEYLDLYHTIVFDYLSAKDVLLRNMDKFTPAEKTRLELFDNYAVMLHGQVKKVEDQIAAGALKKGYDLTEIMMNTGAIIKALSSVAILL